MKVDCFIQGEQTDPQLYALVGHWLVNRGVHQQLGMAVTAEPGDIWHVGREEHDANAFAVTRLQNDQTSAHIRFLFAEKNPAKTRQKLLAECLRWLGAHQVQTAKTFARENDLVWAQAGFALTVRHKKGTFHTWEKTL